jgi:hypothetical protein
MQRGDVSSNSKRRTIHALTGYSGVAILVAHSFFGIAAVYKELRGAFSASAVKLEAPTEILRESPGVQVFAPVLVVCARSRAVKLEVCQ